MCVCVCVTPPSWPHLATPADVALALWPQSRQCGWRANHRGMCLAVLGGEGAGRDQERHSTQALPSIPTSSGSQRPYSGMRVAWPWSSAGLAPALVTFIQCRLPGKIQAHRLHRLWEPLLAQPLAPLPAPSLLPMRDGSGGLGKRPAHKCRRRWPPAGWWGPSFSRPGLEWATRKSSQLPVAFLGWSEESEGFLWRKKWKRNKTGWPCLSHFLLPRQWVACLPLPAGFRRLCGMWAGLGAPC